MTPEEERETALNELAGEIDRDNGDQQNGHTMRVGPSWRQRIPPKVAHLATRSIRDAAHVLRSASTQITPMYSLKYLLVPNNASYRIELFKQFILIHPDFINQWILREVDHRAANRNLTDYDVTPEHAIWSLIDIYYVDDANQHFDYGTITPYVDAIRTLVEEQPGDAEAIHRIIRERKVYKVEEIKSLLPGPSALREGNL